MRFSFTSFSTPRHTLPEILALAATLGYDGFEPRAEHNHRHGIELSLDTDRRSAVRKQVEQSGVALACIATPCRYADPDITDAQLQHTRWYIDLASELGCPLIRVFGGAVAATLTHEQASDMVIRALRKLADYAAQRGVTICVETHDSWCDPAIMAFVMREVGHPAVGVNWDIMHTQREGKASVEEAFRMLRPWLRHVHIHDGANCLDKLKLVPLGRGDFDCRTVLRLLHNGKYAGHVSGEWMESMMDKGFFVSHLASELATLRRYQAEMKQACLR